ncbi:hypothetical protein EV182_006056 [Spiromyces aspiralis]|uniref:Uncharacterized protein n=1 Tax=Spiromyces aspiralis TaxID=68401 RepID=A0ACC1H968_9FUNG|nr:hypothetical protein EV182_006056 [Spiromyces aspiralis]
MLHEWDPANHLPFSLPRKIDMLALLNRRLPRVEKVSSVYRPTGGSPPSKPRPEGGGDAAGVEGLFFFKRDLIRILGNLAYRNRAVQDTVRTYREGLVLIMDHCTIDENHPFVKEYAVVAIRNLLEDNPENQRILNSMQPLPNQRLPPSARDKGGPSPH